MMAWQRFVRQVTSTREKRSASGGAAALGSECNDALRQWKRAQSGIHGKNKCMFMYESNASAALTSRLLLYNI